MATGTVTFSATKNIQPSEQQTTSTGGGILVSMGTYSLPTGCTYSGRAKVTKSVSGSLQFSWRDKEKYGETGWDTWYTVSTSKFKNSSNTVQVYVKNNSGSYINGTWSVVVEYNYPSRTITVGSTTGGTATSNKSSASYGDTVTITATPSTGYSFSGWTTINSYKEYTKCYFYRNIYIYLFTYYSIAESYKTNYRYQYYH